MHNILTAYDIIYNMNYVGTTLKTLKFPILNPIPWRLHLRAKRLLKQRPGYVEENKLRQRMYLKTGDLQYASLIGMFRACAYVCVLP